jgi:phosphonate transport system permease protein
VTTRRPDIAALRRDHPGAFENPVRRHRVALAVAVVLMAILVAGFWALGVPASRFVAGLGKLGAFIGHMLPPSTGTWAKFLVYLHALAETVAIALLAARNIVPQAAIHFLSRRFLDSVRGVDELIWALVWINVVGLGPFAGALAIATSNFGAFGKLFSEAFEAAKSGPVEGVIAAGGAAAHGVRYGVVPEVLPVLLSQILYYFESNTRSATIIGIVGAGGIGLHLSEQIRMIEYQQVCALILMILVVVAMIDAMSSRLRLAISAPRVR